ncbi:MAG: alpha/beta hydrolase [SAR324 cluster bacterium]|nr:alpha/beta hydrolase [SAR324 cluster bacterium]
MQSDFFLEVEGTLLEFRWIPPANPDLPTLIFLHEGLGCAGMWKDFPDQLAHSTECGILIYSRAGYGRSGPARLPRPVRYMHDEGLRVLPEILKKLALTQFFLLGHSDGASIALVYAGSGAMPKASGLILLAPHVFNEKLCVDSIQLAAEAYRTTDLPVKLARYHGNHTDETFWGWHDIWVHPEFWHWNIEEFLSGIDIPVLVIQGADDQYGTTLQMEAIRTQVSGPCTLRLLENCRHSPQKDHPAGVQNEIHEFIFSLRQKAAQEEDR